MRRRSSKVGWVLIVERISRTPVHCTRSPRPRNFYPKLLRTPLHLHTGNRRFVSSFRRFSTRANHRLRRLLLRLSGCADFQAAFSWDRIINPTQYYRKGSMNVPGASFEAFQRRESSRFFASNRRLFGCFPTVDTCCFVRCDFLGLRRYLGEQLIF